MQSQCRVLKLSTILTHCKKKSLLQIGSIYVTYISSFLSYLKVEFISYFLLENSVSEGSYSEEKIIQSEELEFFITVM